MRGSSFKDLEAMELYCPKCCRAVPVRKRLLIVLPEGGSPELEALFRADAAADAAKSAKKK